ncbi:hypothetical protein BDW02DRAFT_563809 [Decorospora gaudefroyi]|uniref:Microbial-type PARG catalytic domain-containing protein n=1 Tax=Decorospora gaudefroyi TaxID=184978 RepID=A0A6A5KR60_9PLEO|nr:hypothetical protein BDW02DRAFT_563809 [Decorospora gaudefroyi]
MEQRSILSFLQRPKSFRPEKSRPAQPYQPRPTTGSTSKHNPKHDSQHRAPNRRRNMELAKVADQTKAVLPSVLNAIPSFNAALSSLFDIDQLGALNPDHCPKFPKGATIQVLDMDTFDAALLLNPDHKVHSHIDVGKDSGDEEKGAKEPIKSDIAMKDADTSENAPKRPELISPNRPVAVMNLASERSPGGGWQNGALAQEECLCYRSSLYLSLHKSYYNLPSLSAIYTPNVVLIRESMSSGHALLTSTQPIDLPALSVISVAALRRPSLSDDGTTYKHAGARAETKRKVRLTLRVAAQKGHTKLVLGALGCGVFANPPGEVAKCFLEVLREEEFEGGWWEEVAFAVLDNVKGPDGGKDGEGNFGHFFRVLDGQVV